MTPSQPPPFTLRRATPDDAPAVLALFDAVIAWFVSIGNTGQWGTEPWSTNPRRIQMIADAVALPEAYIAETVVGAEAGAEAQAPRVVGFLALGDAQSYVPPATEPEVYIRVLVGSPGTGNAPRGVGRFLLAQADRVARARGVPRLRVDCYGGGDEGLVRFYETCGFKRLEEFKVAQFGDWPCQVLERRLDLDG